MRSFRASGNGISLRVLEWDAAASAPSLARPRPTVLLLHGFMDAAGTWDRVAPAIAGLGHRVIAPDLRGFGESDHVPAGGYYHFPDYVADVARVVEAHVDTPLVVVGHSMGGTVATLFAGTQPEKLHKLVVIEGIGPPDHPASAGPVRMRRWLEDLTRLERASSKPIKPMSEADALARLKMNHSRISDDVLRSRLPHLARPSPDGTGLVWRFDPLHRTTAPMPFFAEVFTTFADLVKCPVLYVSGGSLGYRPPDEAERLAHFENLTKVDLEHSGHMIHWTTPDLLVDELARFLGE
ncbi:alpha/beta hydrolase [soil metagenome]